MRPRPRARTRTRRARAAIGRACSEGTPPPTHGGPIGSVRQPRARLQFAAMATTVDRGAAESLAAWRANVYERAPERTDELFTTISGIENEPLAAPENVETDYARDLGYPGAYPYTRGVYPSMYRGRLWTMRQFAGFGTAEETNERFRYLLEHGQTGLSV